MMMVMSNITERADYLCCSNEAEEPLYTCISNPLSVTTHDLHRPSELELVGGPLASMCAHLPPLHSLADVWI